MSGFAGALAASYVTSYIVTVAGGGPEQFGFASGFYGAVSPTTLKGKTLFGILGGYTGSPAYDFQVTMTGFSSNPGQSGMFSAVYVQPTTGATRTFNASASTFTYNSGDGSAEWRWGSGSSFVWTSGGSVTKLVQFV